MNDRPFLALLTHPRDRVAGVPSAFRTPLEPRPQTKRAWDFKLGGTSSANGTVRRKLAYRKTCSRNLQKRFPSSEFLR